MRPREEYIISEYRYNFIHWTKTSNQVTIFICRLNKGIKTIHRLYNWLIESWYQSPNYQIQTLKNYFDTEFTKAWEIPSIP